MHRRARRRPLVPSGGALAASPVPPAASRVALARLPLALALALVFAAGCASDDGGPVSRPGMRAENAVGLSFAVPESWQSATPTSTLRAAQFLLPPTGEGGEPPELVLFHFGEGKGGEAKANIDRWIGQMQSPDGGSAAEKARREERKAGGFHISLVEVDGDLGASTMGAGMGGGDPHVHPHGGGVHEDYRLWGAVVEGKGGPWFFKATGPRAAMEEAADGFDALVESLRPAAGAGAGASE